MARSRRAVSKLEGWTGSSATRRRWEVCVRALPVAILAPILLLLAAVSVPPVAQAQTVSPPNLLGVHSRKTHGTVGTFDLLLAATPVSPTIEPRSGSVNGNHVVVFTFDKAVTAGSASITEGQATLGAPTFNGSEMAVPLSGTANAQYLTVVVNNVTASDGGTGGNGWIRLGFLTGNTSGSQTGLSLADWPALTAAISQPVTTQNFLFDLNTDGSLTLLDKIVMLGGLSQFLPPPNIPLPTAGSVVASSTAFANFVSSPFNLAATFSSNSGPVTSCDYSADGGATWAPGVVSGNIPSFTCSKTGITASDGQVLSLTMRATNAAGTSAAAAITRTVDAAVPTNGTLSAAPGNVAGCPQLVGRLRYRKRAFRLGPVQARLQHRKLAGFLRRRHDAAVRNSHDLHAHRPDQRHHVFLPSLRGGFCRQRLRRSDRQRHADRCQSTPGRQRRA